MGLPSCAHHRPNETHADQPSASTTVPCAAPAAWCVCACARSVPCSAPAQRARMRSRRRGTDRGRLARLSMVMRAGARDARRANGRDGQQRVEARALRARVREMRSPARTVLGARGPPSSALRGCGGTLRPRGAFAPPTPPPPSAAAPPAAAAALSALTPPKARTHARVRARCATSCRATRAWCSARHASRAALLAASRCSRSWRWRWRWPTAASAAAAWCAR